MLAGNRNTPVKVWEDLLVKCAESNGRKPRLRRRQFIKSRFSAGALAQASKRVELTSSSPEITSLVRQDLRFDSSAGNEAHTGSLPCDYQVAIVHFGNAQVSGQVWINPGGLS
jgi:hypothetical protein